MTEINIERSFIGAVILVIFKLHSQRELREALDSAILEIKKVEDPVILDILEGLKSLARDGGMFE